MSYKPVRGEESNKIGIISYNIYNTGVSVSFVLLQL